MFYVNTFNDITNESEKLFFDDFDTAFDFCKTNGFQKFRGWNGAEYFI
mgnify:CR=1 FL=1